MLASGYIYDVFCTVNGKHYVGQTWQTVNVRWRAHVRAARAGNNNCVKLMNAIRKHSPTAFVVTPLVQCSEQETLDAAESYWIGYLNSIHDGYNLKEGGAHGLMSPEARAKMSGRIHSAETRMKMSAQRLGRRHSAETRAKMVIANKGKHTGPLSIEHRNKLSIANRGKTRSAATRAKMSAATLRRGQSKEYRAKLSAAAHNRWRDPALHEKISAANRRRWSSPDAREKQAAAMRGNTNGKGNRRAP